MLSPYNDRAVSSLARQLNSIMESSKQLNKSVQARELIEGSICQNVPTSHAEEIDVVTRVSALIGESPAVPISTVAFGYYMHKASQITKQNWEMAGEIDMNLSLDLLTAYVRNW